jgi:hypothetical protein
MDTHKDTGDTQVNLPLLDGGSVRDQHRELQQALTTLENTASTNPSGSTRSPFGRAQKKEVQKKTQNQRSAIIYESCCMAATPMLVRSANAAPKFSDKAADLAPYFEEFKQLCEDHRLTVLKDKIRMAVHYILAEDQQSWKTLPSFSGETDTNGVTTYSYKEFKTEVFELYPEAEQTAVVCATQADLDKLVRKRAKYPILSRMDIGDYHRKFQVQALQLVRKGYMSENEVNFAYLNGYNNQNRLRARIEARLDLKTPDRDLNLALT